MARTVHDGRRRGAARARGTGAAAIALVALAALTPPAGAASRFTPVDSPPIPRERLFDVGAVDYDGDGLLDVFTSNHKFHSALLHNQGGGALADVAGAAGFSPTPQFPGYESLRVPRFDRDGVYVYATDPKGEKMPGLLHVRSVGVSSQVLLSFGADSATLRSLEGGDDAQGRSESGQPIIYLALRPGGSADIQASHLDLPVAADFTSPEIPGKPGLPPIIPPTPPSNEPLPPIYVGTNAVSAPASFVLSLRDRHGLAWADVNGDPGMDAFITTGGLGGAISLPGYEGRVQDELFTQGSGATFTETSSGLGLAKGTCRARQSAAVDADADGRLDLFETCAGAGPSLFLQRAGGGFRSVPPPRGSGSVYRWVDLGGARPALLSAEPRGLRVLTYAPSGRWRSRQLVPLEARRGEVSQLAITDLDSDADLDVLAVSGTGNTLLENRRGRLVPRSLRATGIPRASVAASFVDFDNDGRTDLDLIPQGLQRGVGDLRFRGTGALRDHGRIGAGTTIWPDLDNDGLRDPIRLTANAEFARRKRVSAARNTGPGGHWLELDLRGRAGNREAIGAWVGLKAGGRARYQWVGQNDDSHHSQGHYRLYFGLGGRDRASNVVVHWPDGERTNLGAVEADQVLEVAAP